MKWLRRYLDERSPTLKNFAEMAGTLAARSDGWPGGFTAASRRRAPDPSRGRPREVGRYCTYDACGGPRYGNAVKRSVWGPRSSPWTFPLVNSARK